MEAQGLIFSAEHINLLFFLLFQVFVLFNPSPQVFLAVLSFTHNEIKWHIE